MCVCVCVRMCGSVCCSTAVAAYRRGAAGLVRDRPCVCQYIYVSLSPFICCIALWCVCVCGGQQVCHAVELVASLGVFSQ